MVYELFLRDSVVIDAEQPILVPSLLPDLGRPVFVERVFPIIYYQNDLRVKKTTNHWSTALMTCKLLIDSIQRILNEWMEMYAKQTHTHTYRQTALMKLRLANILNIQWRDNVFDFNAINFPICWMDSKVGLYLIILNIYAK